MMENLKKPRSDKLGSLHPQTNNQHIHDHANSPVSYWRTIMNIFWGNLLVKLVTENRLETSQIQDLKNFIDKTYDAIQPYLKEQYQNPEWKKHMATTQEENTND